MPTESKSPWENAEEISELKGRMDRLEKELDELKSMKDVDQVDQRIDDLRKTVLYGFSIFATLLAALIGLLAYVSF